MIVHNLNLYEEHEDYYNLYTKNNNKLNDVIQDIIQKYNFNYEPKKYYRMHANNMITRNIYELSGLIIMLNAVIEKNIYGYCIKTSKKYKCEKMYYLNSTVAKFLYTAYHFNCLEDEFVIYFAWEYFSPMLIHYPKNDTVFNINYRFSAIEHIINESNLNHSIPYYPQDNFISYAIGIMHNAGHYMWQEIYGLMLLFEYNLLDNIDEFLIYKYDYLNIANILKNKYNKQITILNSNSTNHNCTINLSKHFISTSLNEYFKNVYELKSINNQNEINILIDIRSNSRVWLNQHENIINLIQTAKQKYRNYNVNFYISGFFTHNTEFNHNYFYDYNKEIHAQNIMFNNIQSSIECNIYNLINSNLCDIVKICQKIDICISNTGSGASFFNLLLFNKCTVLFTLRSITDDFNVQRDAFENRLSNGKYLPKHYIIDNNNNFYLQNGILTPLVISVIDQLILPSKFT